MLAGGSVGAKLAAGCLLALGLGVGCVALTAGPRHGGLDVHARGSGGAARLDSSTLAGGPAPVPRAGHAWPKALAAPLRPLALAPAASAGTTVREFGPEQGAGPGAPPPVAAVARHAAARSTTSAAQREFGPG
jgi:hypothetical protein